MKALVTGAAGLLGSHLCDALLAAGHSVLGLDDLSGGYGDNVDVESLAINITEPFIMDDFAAIFHCAALAYEGLSVFSPRLISENIVVGSVNTMVAAINAGVKTFVNCSSMARYGRQEVPYAEHRTPQPCDPYGISKLAAEGILDVLGEQHGVRVVHVVPHNIIGPRQKYDDPYRNVASIMVNLMLQGRQPIIYGDGEQERCFSFVGDVIPTILQIAERGKHGEVFNVGPDHGEVTVNELARRIAALLGFKLAPVYVPARPREVRAALCSSAKIRKRFGFEQKTTLDDGLQSIIDYIKKRGPLPFTYHLPLEIVNETTPRPWKERMF